MAIILYIPYSRKMLRTPIFEDIEVFAQPRKFYPRILSEVKK